MLLELWSIEGIIISAVLVLAAALVGVLVGVLPSAKQRGQLQAELEQTQQSLAQQRTELAAAVQQCQQQEQSLKQQQLDFGRLDERFKAVSADNARLGQELQEAKQNIAQGLQRLEQSEQLQHQKASQLQAALASNHSLMEQLDEAKARIQLQERLYQELQQEHQRLSTEQAELRTSLSGREQHFKEQLAQLEDAKKLLGQEFENIANKVFEEKNKAFTQSSQTNIDQLLKPFREQIDAFQKRTNEVHDESLKGRVQLNLEIQKVLDIGLKMSADAHNLTSALKGDPQQRGAWGEAQLGRTLEMSGLIADAHYEVQSSFLDGDGKRKQTDYLVKLPDGKHLIIDSKVTLNAYDRAVSAETPEEHQFALDEHCKAVRAHIDDLAKKDYTNLIGMRSPSFVLMFMPIEPAYIEVLKFDKSLFEYGYKKGIVLVSHTTLIPILRTVANLWMLEKSTNEAREISEKAGEIYNQVCLVAERLQKLGNTLSTVSSHYNSTVTALAGQQGLYGKVERFNQLSTKVSKSLPALSTNLSDFESERLELIAAPALEADAEVNAAAEE